MTHDPNDPCLECRIAAGELSPPGKILVRESGLMLHLPVMPCPIAGWLVIASERHARALYDLDAGELTALGPLAARAMNAMREALGAEHAYAFAIGDVLRHFHLHIFPRYADTPERLRGRGAFDTTAADALSEDILAEAAARLITAMR